MTPDESEHTIDGYPVRWNDTMPKEVVANGPPILFGKRPGVFRLKVAMCDDGVVRPTEGPENAKVVKELSDWLKQWSGVVGSKGEQDA